MDGLSVTNLLWNNQIPFMEFLASFLGAVVQENLLQDLFMRTFPILKEFLHFSLELLAGDGFSQKGAEENVVFCSNQHFLFQLVKHFYVLRVER